MSSEMTSPGTTSSGWKPDWRPIDACPACGAIELHPVFDGELMNFLCPLCMACWHVELGFIHKINPLTCPGCQFRLTCIEYQQHDHADATALPASGSGG